MGHMTEQVETTRRTGPPTWAIVGLFVFALAAGALAWTLREESPQTGDEAGARDACHTFVERRLKSPGSANYPADNATLSDGAWTVTGYVDSQNSFGASMRNQYRCVATTSNGDDWTLTSLDVSRN